MANNKKTGSIPGTSKKRSANNKRKVKTVAEGNCRFVTEDNQKVKINEMLSESGWDDLNRLYYECKALTIIPAQITPLVTNTEHLNRVKDLNFLVEQVKVLAKDNEHYNNELEEVHATHADRKGGYDDPNDLADCLTIGEVYQQWLIAYQTVVVPNVHEILTMFNDGMEIALEEEKSKIIEGEFIETQPVIEASV